MLQWLRRVKSKRSFRILAMIGVTILSVGLIGSFVIWSILQFSHPQANNQTPVDPSVSEEMENRISELEHLFPRIKRTRRFGNWGTLMIWVFKCLWMSRSALALAKLNSALKIMRPRWN